ncbi:MAG: SMP-30/gluconolactonase/LRE family protein [Bacteroidales bacterium]
MKRNLIMLMLLVLGALLLSWNPEEQPSAKAPSNPQPHAVDSITGSVLRLHPGMDDVVPRGALPEIIAEGFVWSEGPLWLPDQQVLIFSDVPQNSIYQWSEKDGLKLYLKPSGYTGDIPRGGETGSNGLLLNAMGQLVLCQHGDRRMALMDAPLSSPEPRFITLADRWNGKRFNSPNDAVFSKDGDLYFTDPAYGMEQRYQDPAREMDFTGVFKVGNDGVVSLLTDKLGAPNGIGFTPDGNTLIVSNSGGGENSFWMAYEVSGDGSLINERMFYDASAASDTLAGSPDGLEIWTDGTMFATGPGGVWIFDRNGTHLGIVMTGQPTSNCTLDADQQYLYMTANMYLMRIRLKGLH